MKQLILKFSLLSLLSLLACNQDTEGPGGETPDGYSTLSFTYVDPETEECLIGPNKPIHPDSIRLFDETMLERPLTIFEYGESGLWSVETIDYNHLDSFYNWDGISIYETSFFILINSKDYDTVTLQFDPSKKYAIDIWYNGKAYQGGLENYWDYSSLFLRKEIIQN